MNEDSVVLMAHGAGGKKSAELVRGLFLHYFDNPVLNRLEDSAVLARLTGRLAFTTDSFVVDPLFFPGGDIGKLAVCGTVNDLAASGARPVALSAAFILEEGLDFETLGRVVKSIRHAADEAGVYVVAGDTKVVPRGSADKMFITMSGVGELLESVECPGPNKARPGDVVLLSGTIADHGIAVMLQREGMRFVTNVSSDCAPLWALVSNLLESAPSLHCLRDPTRGGVAAALNEIAVLSGVNIEIDETMIPVSEGVRVACDLLGIDPLHVANEGKMIVILPESEAGVALRAMKAHPLGERSAIIGVVKESPPGQVHLRTKLGTVRVLDVPSGDILPRIC